MYNIHRLTNSYIHGADISGMVGGAGGIGGLLMSARHEPDGTVSRKQYIYDSQGNVRHLVEVGATQSENSISATYEYDPYGRLVYADTPPADEIEPQFLYSTKLYESHWCMYYYGYRYYSPDLGRWLSRDPIGVLGGINLYGFVGNNSIIFVDTLGEKEKELNCVTRRVTFDLGKVFNVLKKVKLFGKDFNITAFIRFENETCDLCCEDDRYIREGRLKVKMSGGDSISGDIPTPWVEPGTGAGLYFTVSGTMKGGGEVYYNHCCERWKGKLNGSLIVFLGGKGKIISRADLEVSGSIEGGFSCKLVNFKCNKSGCPLNFKCRLRARVRGTVSVLFIKREKIWNFSTYSRIIRVGSLPLK